MARRNHPGFLTPEYGCASEDSAGDLQRRHDLLNVGSLAD